MSPQTASGAAGIERAECEVEEGIFILRSSKLRFFRFCGGLLLDDSKTAKVRFRQIFGISDFQKISGRNRLHFFKSGGRFQDSEKSRFHQGDFKKIAENTVFGWQIFKNAAENVKIAAPKSKIWARDGVK